MLQPVEGGSYPCEVVPVNVWLAPVHLRCWGETFTVTLGSPKRRRKFLDCLNHCSDLDPRFVHTLPSNADVVGLLRSHGAPAIGYVVSDSALIDGREMHMEEAVSGAELGGWGTIVSCIPARLAHCYDEGGEPRCLLVREKAQSGLLP
jgi:hypothetical protein